MSDDKFKVYCTYKNDWDFSGFKNIEIKSNKKEILSREEFLNEIKGCHGILSNPRCPRIDAEALDAAGAGLKVVSTTSAGYNYIDVAECTKRGVKIGYLANTFTEAVAEFAIGLVITASRKIVEGSKYANTLDWNVMNDLQLLRGKSLRGSTVGIFGLGKIGLSIAKKLSAFGVHKIIYNSRHANPAASDHVQYVSFEALLNESDFLICCASLNKETENIFNMKAFEKMKKGSIFINVARGAMVNQDDLYEALTTKVIAYAAIDVTIPEPLPKDHKLYSLSNCVITPHIAGDDEKTRAELREIGLLNLINGLTGKPLIHEVI